MKKIAITGSLGTGKTLTSNYFKSLGHLVINADIVNNELLKEENIIIDVNKLLFNEYNNDLDKKRISKLIFKNEEKKKELENYLHPLIYLKIDELIKSSKEEYIFLEIPLLYETDFINLVDYVIVVFTEEEKQIKRIIKRDNITRSEALKRIKNQMPIKEKLIKADYIINNSDSIEETNKQLKKWYDSYIRRA